MLTNVFVPFGKGAFQQVLHSVIEYNNNTFIRLVCHSFFPSGEYDNNTKTNTQQCFIYGNHVLEVPGQWTAFIYVCQVFVSVPSLLCNTSSASLYQKQELSLS